jgi:O-antigen/teichoic acid export membrane protein
MNKAAAIASMWIGPSNIGDFAVSIRWSHNLAHLFVMGQEAILLMYLSQYHKSPSKQSGLVKWIIRSTLIKTVCLISIVAVALLVDSHQPLEIITKNFWIGFLVIPFVVACGIYERFFLFLQHFFTSFLSRGIYQPIIFILLMFGIQHYFEPSPNTTIIAYIIAFMLATGIYAIQGYRADFALSKETDFSDKEEWQLAGLFYTFSTLIIKSTPSIALYFLENLGDSEIAVGHFYALSNLTYGFHLLTKPFDGYLKPSIARLFATNQLSLLQEKLNYVNRIRWSIISLLFMFLIFVGQYMLSQYGPSFTDVYLPLLLLAFFYSLQYLGQPAHELLNYTGHQKKLSIIMAVQFLLIAVLCKLLIPTLGIWGAVIAQGSPCVLATLVSAHILRKNTGVKAYFFF